MQYTQGCEFKRLSACLGVTHNSRNRYTVNLSFAQSEISFSLIMEA